MKSATMWKTVTEREPDYGHWLVHVGGDIKLELLDGSRQPISEKVEHYYRKDLLSVFPECDKEAKPGFPGAGNRSGRGQSGPFYLEMRGAKNHSRTRLTRSGTRARSCSM